jgi:isochorismate hydrolase
MKKISEMQNYIVNFAQENMQVGTSKIENTVKKYLLRLKTNVAELNRNFNKEYKLCKNHLQEFNRICHGSTDKKQSQIKYNNKYVKTLHNIDNSLERAISAFYQSNILGVMKTLNQLCQRNNIVAVYNKITIKLSSHFHILTQ